MKKILFFMMLLILSTTSFTQKVSTANSYSREDYLKKSNQQKITGFLLLAGGVALGTITAAHPDEWTLSSLLGPFIGLGITIYSVHFFNKAADNKRKANLMIKDESVFFNPNLNIKQHLLSVGLRLDL